MDEKENTHFKIQQKDNQKQSTEKDYEDITIKVIAPEYIYITRSGRSG